MNEQQYQRQIKGKGQPVYAEGECHNKSGDQGEEGKMRQNYPPSKTGKAKGKKGVKLGSFLTTGEEPPRYDPRDRAMFTRLFNGNPEELKQCIAFNFLHMPHAGAQELGRMLFCNYGALIVEVRHLFECEDLEEIKK